MKREDGPHGGVMFELPGKPVSINRLSKASHHAVSGEIKTWRASGFYVGKSVGVTFYDCRVFVYVHQHNKGPQLPDCASSYFATKGGLDGLVDAGVIGDDSPKYVAGLFFLAPVCGTDDRLILELVEE